MCDLRNLDNLDVEPNETHVRLVRGEGGYWEVSMMDEDGDLLEYQFWSQAVRGEMKEYDENEKRLSVTLLHKDPEDTPEPQEI